MEQPLTSSTDVAHSHLGHAGVLEAEPLAGEPALDGLDLLAEGSPEQVRSHPEVVRAYLGEEADSAPGTPGGSGVSPGMPGGSGVSPGMNVSA